MGTLGKYLLLVIHTDQGNKIGNLLLQVMYQPGDAGRAPSTPTIVGAVIAVFVLLVLIAVVVTVYMR